MKRILLHVMILLHHMIVVVVIITPFYLLYAGNILLALWVAVMSIRVVTSNDRCVLTAWENKVREEVGLPTIKAFVHHYYMRHFK